MLSCAMFFFAVEGLIDVNSVAHNMLEIFALLCQKRRNLLRSNA